MIKLLIIDQIYVCDGFVCFNYCSPAIVLLGLLLVLDLSYIFHVSRYYKPNGREMCFVVSVQQGHS